MVEGARVAACGRKREALESSAHCFAVGDLTKKGVCEELVSSSVEQLGGESVRVCVRLSYCTKDNYSIQFFA